MITEINNKYNHDDFHVVSDEIIKQLIHNGYYTPEKAINSCFHTTFNNMSCICNHIYINNIEYQLCNHYSRNLGSRYSIKNYSTEKQKKKYVYKDGFGKPFEYPRRGLLGEMAFAKLQGLSINFNYESRGYDYDFIDYDFHNLKIEVKLSMELYSFQTALLDCGTVDKVIPLKSDIYVFCYIDHSDRYNEDEADVYIAGWISRKRILLTYNKKHLSRNEIARDKGKVNYEIPYSCLNHFPDKNYRDFKIGDL